MHQLKIKRVYESKSRSDGIRILVDRLWPRGITKENAHVKYWLKDIAPSDELRKRFNHEPDKWLEFKKQYFQELHSKQEILIGINELLKSHDVTLVYAAKNEKFNNATALHEYLCKH